MRARIPIAVAFVLLAGSVAGLLHQVRSLQHRVAVLERQTAAAAAVPVVSPADLQFRLRLIESRVQVIETTLEPTFIHQQLEPKLRSIRDYPPLFGNPEPRFRGGLRPQF